MKRLKKYEMSPYDDVPVEVVFEVSKTYKGFKKAESSKRFTLMTSLSQHTCAGYPFEIEKEYLIFAYKRRIESPEHWSLYKYPSGSYGTGGLCGGTKKLTDAKSDLASIRKWRENDREKAKGKGYGIPTEALPQFGF